MSPDDLTVIPADHGYLVDARCPHCGQTDQIALELAARLETTRAESRLGLKVKQTKAGHTCAQTALTVVAETGEVMRLDLGEDRR